jgi:cell division ATPase FtsA
LSELGREILQMPVRIGAPAAHLPIAGLSRKLMTPAHATSIGLLLWGLEGENRLWRRRYDVEEGNGRSVWISNTMQWLRNLLPD